MKKISIICPICKKFKRTTIPPEIFSIDEGSLLKLPIPIGKICDHSFVVILDYHFKIRDYEIINSEIDFQNFQKKQKIIKPLSAFSSF